MRDENIVELYWNRDEQALEETKVKYEHYLLKIAHNVLTDYEDSKESENDMDISRSGTFLDCS